MSNDFVDVDEPKDDENNQASVEIAGEEQTYKETRLSGYLRSALNDLREFVKHNWDGIGIITGYEGDGKTTLALLCAYYLDKNLSIDNIVFNARQFTEAVERAKPESVIVWDEADEIAASNWANLMFRALKQQFKRIRKYRLYIFLVTPTLFDLSKYFVVHRTRFLLDVYAKPYRDDHGRFVSNRGNVRFFDRKKKRLLYIKGYKEWDMYSVIPNFVDAFGSLPNNFPVNMDAYEDKKDAAFKELGQEGQGGRNGQQAIVKNNITILLAFRTWYNKRFDRQPTDSECARALGWHRHTIMDYFVKISQQNSGLAVGSGEVPSDTAEKFVSEKEEGKGEIN